MKKLLIFALLFAYALTLTGCGRALTAKSDPPFALAPSASLFPAEMPEIAQEPVTAPDIPDMTEGPRPPEDLPAALATPEDLDGSGGYLLLGEVPEADIALYCDNSEERNAAYLRYGEHFQAFDQKAWVDPTVLPELHWQDWDEDGAMELVVKYLRHEGIFFDGETTSPGLVCEQVVYKWEEDQWIDLHFYSSGPLAAAD